MNRLLSLPALVAMVLFSSVAHATLLINNTSTTNNFAYPVGAPDASTYGEAFHTNGSDTVLNSFSMFLSDGNGSLNFRGYIGAWNGSNVTSILYTSSTVSATPAGGTFTFLPGIQLASNSNYIAFFSIADLAAQPAAQFYIPISYPNGDIDPFTDGFYYLNNGTDASQWTGSTWNSFGANVVDAQFVAELDAPVSAVPEPASLALFGLGIAGLGCARRKREFS
jgi:hypothetical protein